MIDFIPGLIEGFRKEGKKEAKQKQKQKQAGHTHINVIGTRNCWRTEKGQKDMLDGDEGSSYMYCTIHTYPIDKLGCHHTFNTLIINAINKLPSLEKSLGTSRKLDEKRK